MSAEVDQLRARFAEADTLEEAFGNAAGFFSTCWENQNPNALFRGEIASEALAALIAHVDVRVKKSLLAHVEGMLDLRPEAQANFVRNFNIWNAV